LINRKYSIYTIIINNKLGKNNNRGDNNMSVSKKAFLIISLLFFSIPQILFGMEQKKRALDGLDETFLTFYATFNPAILEKYLADIREIREDEGDPIAYQELFAKIQGKLGREVVLEDPRIGELAKKLDAIVKLEAKSIEELGRIVQDIQKYSELTKDETRYGDLFVRIEGMKRQKALREVTEREALERLQREREKKRRQREETEQRRREVEVKRQRKEEVARLQRERKEAVRREREEEKRRRKKVEVKIPVIEKERQEQIGTLEIELAGIRQVLAEPENLKRIISDMTDQGKINLFERIEKYLQLLSEEEREKQATFFKPATTILTKHMKTELSQFIDDAILFYEIGKKEVVLDTMNSYSLSYLKILTELINKRIKTLKEDDPRVQILNELLNQVEVRIREEEPTEVDPAEAVRLQQEAEKARRQREEAERLRKIEEARRAPIKLIPTDATAMKNLRLCPFPQCVKNLGVKNGLNRQLLQISMAKQTEARCGGLSLINALWTEKYVNSGNRTDLTYLHNSKNVKRILDNIGCGNWVSIEQVKAYIENAKNKGFDVSNIDSISSVLVFDAAKAEFLFKEEAATGQKIKDKIGKGLGKDYFFHGIIVGDEEAQEKGFGHYFAFVIIKSGGQVQYVVIDSLDTNHLTDEYKRLRINYLIDQLETGRAGSLIPFTRFQIMTDDVKEKLKQFTQDKQSLSEKDFLKKYSLGKLMEFQDKIEEYRVLTEGSQEFQDELDTIRVLLVAQRARAEELEKETRGKFEEIKEEIDSIKRKKRLTTLILGVGTDKEKLGSEKSRQLVEEFIESWCKLSEK